MMILGALSACGTRPNLDRPTPPAATDTDVGQRFDDAVRAFERGDDAAARQAFDTLEPETESEPLGGHVRYYLARIEARQSPERGGQRLVTLAETLEEGDLKVSAEVYGGLALSEARRCDRGAAPLARHVDTLAPPLRARAQLALARCGRGQAALVRLAEAATTDPRLKPLVENEAKEALTPMSLEAIAEALPALADGPLGPTVRSHLETRARSAGRDDLVALATGGGATAAIGPEVTAAGARLGVMLPLTGRSRRVGERLAADIEVLFGDTEDKPGDAPQVRTHDGGSAASIALAFEAMKKDEVVGVVGLFDQDLAEVAAKAAAQAGLPLVMLTLNDAAVQTEGPIWRALQTPLLVARTAAGAALARTGGPRLAQVVRSDDPYGQVLGHWFAEVWKAGGGTLVEAVRLDAKEADWSRYAKGIRKGGAEVIFMPTSPREGARLLSHLAAEQVWALGTRPRFAKDKQVREVTMIGPPEWYDPEFLRQAAHYGDRVLIPVPFASETARGAPLAEKLLARTGRPPIALDALLADAVNALDRAGRAAAKRGLAVQDTLRTTVVDDGYTAGLDFAEREALPALILLEVRDGKFAPAP